LARRHRLPDRGGIGFAVSPANGLSQPSKLTDTTLQMAQHPGIWR
jgi:hypothetical protein